ncbi:hypothetical protein [Methylobacterium oxalidis]
MVIATAYLAALAYLLECVHRAPYVPDAGNAASTNGYGHQLKAGPAE